jgi:RNA polymerase sigma-70 factor (ECF subfamily)
VNRDQDAEDARRVLAGDVEAFAGIVERWQRPLWRLALRFADEPSEAEDLAQEAFLRAFRALGSWRGEAAFSTWLIALATNVYRSHARRPRRLLARFDEERHAAARAPEPAGPDRVRRALLALPRRYREALELYYFHALDLRAAARSLELGEGTLKARLSRGRRLLARLLEPDKENDRRER